MGGALLSGPAARMPASWMSRNRCQASGSDLSGGLHQPAHRQDKRHDVARGDARVHRAGRYGARGELVDRCSYPVSGGVVGLARQEQARVARMVGEGLAEGAQQFFETVAVGTRQRPFGGRQDLLERQLEQFIDQRVLAGEPAVHGADAHSGPRGDLLHARVGAGLAEHLARGVEDAVIVPHGVAPRRRGPGSGHSLLSPTTVPPATIAISPCSGSPTLRPPAES